MTRRPSLHPRLIAVVALGGAVGGVLRWGAGVLVPDGSGFPTTTFAINVVGSLLLALLPAARAVRRHEALAVALGPGVMGGFTTLSASSEQTRGLLDGGRPVLGLGYLLGTLTACLLAVALASRLSTAAQQRQVEDEGGDL